jgi:hypothetical protein
VSEILNQIPTDALGGVFDDWMRRLQQYIAINGEHVEQRLFFSICGFSRITHSGDATIWVEYPVYGGFMTYDSISFPKT